MLGNLVEGQGDTDEYPAVTVFLDEFQMGRWEVTKEQWNQCVRSGTCEGALFDAS